jgi:hypothetical protein
VTCHTQPCRPCEVTYILHYPPQRDESSPSGSWGICAPALPEVLTSLAEDVDYIDIIDDMPLCDLQYKLDVHIQHHTTMVDMSTKGQHRTGKGILVGENWKETTETHFVEDTNEL